MVLVCDVVMGYVWPFAMLGIVVSKIAKVSFEIYQKIVTTNIHIV